MKLLILTLPLILAARLSASTYTWDGSFSNSWLDSSNWSGVLALPLTDDEVVFPSSGANKSMDNNLGAGVAINRVTFSGSGYSTNGDSISLSSTVGTPLLRTTHTSGITTINSPLSLAEASTFSTVAGGTLTTSFLGTVANNSHTLTLDSDGTISFLGTISGTAGVTMTGAGLVTYGGTQSYSGGTALNAGRLNIATGATVSTSTITVAAAATLSGTGTAAAVTSSGTLSPGNTAIGRLTAAGTVTFNNVATSTLALDLGTAATEASTYDQLRCQSGVSIGTASVLQINPTGTFTPAVNDVYTLLDKTIAGAISGTFSGLPQNGTVDVANRRLRISYTGGDGNDLTATVVNAPPTATSLSVAETYTEDTAEALTEIVISDLENSGITTTLTLSNPAAGTLNTGTSGTVTSTYNAGTGVWSASGAIANVNTLLAGLIFTPAANFNGSFTIASSISDGVAAALTGSKTMTGTPVNDAPAASNLSAAESYTEDIPRNLTDIVVSDVDSATVTATFTLSNPAAGSLNTGTSGAVTSTYDAVTGVWSASGAITGVNTLLAGLTFTPAANFNFSFTITTNVSDSALSVTGNKTMTGTPVNDAPTATNLSAAETYMEDAALNLVNIVVSDIDSSTVTATLTLSNTAAGSLTTGTSGAVTSSYNPGTGVWTASGAIANVNTLLAAVSITPAANFNSGFTIATSVSDSALSVTGSKTLTGTPVNDAPTATNLSASETYTEDTPKNLTDIEISDVDGNSVTATLTLSSPSVGSFNTASSGSTTSTYNPSFGRWTATGPITEVNTLLAGLTFNPVTNFNSNFSITTSASDGVTSTPAGNKIMTGTPVNDAPTAFDATVTTNPNQAKTISLAASDPDSGSFTFSIVTAPSHGTLSGGTSATRTYTPSSGYIGTDSFVFRANDGQLSSNDATITIVVNFPPTINDLPDLVLNEDTASGAIPIEIHDVETVETSLVLSGSSSNPALVPGANIVFSGSGANRGVTITPAPNISGAATVTISVSDGSIQTSDTFVLTVNPVDDPPPAANQNVNGTEDASVNITFPATDADGQPLAYSFPSGPSNGSLSGSGTSRTYTPNANFSGTDSFNFTASDGTSTSAPATVSLTIAPVNDMPSFTKGIVPTVEANSGPQSFPAWAKNIDDGDAETAQSLTFNVTNDSNALFSVQPAVSANGTLTFTPAAGAFGKATMSVSLTDDSSAGGAALTTAVQTNNLYVGFLPPIMTVGGPGAQFSSLTNTGGAFSAINTRTQRENLVVRITGDLLSETGLITLNTPFVEPSGAQYSITIVPTGAPRRITGDNIAALVRLNGVDRVTIDGSLDGSGTDQSLTITNTNTNNNAVVWLQNLGANGTISNTIRNLDLVGGGSAICGVGSGSSSISLTSDGSGNHSNTFSNNTVRRAYWGIYSGGNNEGTVISGNQLTAGGSDQLTRGGILVRGENAPLITGNRIANVTGNSLVDVFGISLGLTDCSTTSQDGGSVSGATVTGNLIHQVTNLANGSAVGIAVAKRTGATLATSLIVNNSISSVGAFGSHFNLGAGLLIGGGTNSPTRLLFNSISMSGALSNVGTPCDNFAVAIGSENPAVELRNNVLSNTLTVTGTAGNTGRGYLVGTASATFSGLVSNNNDFFQSAGGDFRTGRSGSLAHGAGSDLATLADWKPATSQDAASFAADPLFNSRANLRPLPGSPLGNAATPMPEITGDLSGTPRGATTPTIGAFETTSDTSPPRVSMVSPANTASLASRTLSGVSITDFSGVANTAPLRPRLYFRKSTHLNTFADNTPATNGWKFTAAQGTGGGPFTFFLDYSILFGGGVSPGDVIEYFFISQDLLAPTPNAGNEDVKFATGPASVELSSAAFPISGSTNSYRIALPISGVVTVGIGGDFPCLTLPGGLFDAINQRVLTGNLEARIVSNLPDETGEIDLNAPVEEPLGSHFGIKVCPTGTAREISGSSPVINLTGVDRFILDGSLNGSGADRSLSITATDNSFTDVIRIMNSGTDGATDNVLRNLVVSGSSREFTFAGISSGTPTAPSYLNHRNTISNNRIQRAKWGVYLLGENDDNVVSGNEMTSSSPDNLWFGGIYIGTANNPVISGNVIRNIGGSTLGDQPVESPFGISLGMESSSAGFLNGTTSAVVSGNTIHGVTCLGGRAVGIAAGSGTIINNSVSGISAITGRVSNPVGGAGILVGGNSVAMIRLYYNSVFLSGNTSFPGSDEPCAHSAFAQVTEGDSLLELKNNVFSNTLVCTSTGGGVGRSFAISMASNSFIHLESDHNDLHVGSGSGFRIGSSGSVDPLSALATNHPTLTDWQSFSLRDFHSISVDPQFTALDNLMPPAGSALAGTGIPVSGSTTDILGLSRHLVTPTIGAYELSVGLQTLETWRQLHFGTSSNNGSAANGFDFDKDGLVNLIEFAFGLDPTIPDAGNLPQAQRVGNELVISFTEPPGVSGITYGGQSSETLAPDDWHPVPDTGNLPNHEFRLATGTKPKDFVRLTVTGQAEELASP